jgi:hypothetical protein
VRLQIGPRSRQPNNVPPSAKGGAAGRQGCNIEHGKQPEAPKLRRDSPPLLGRALLEVRGWRRRLICASCFSAVPAWVSCPDSRATVSTAVVSGHARPRSRPNGARPTANPIRPVQEGKTRQFPRLLPKVRFLLRPLTRCRHRTRVLRVLGRNEPPLGPAKTGVTGGGRNARRRPGGTPARGRLDRMIGRRGWSPSSRGGTIPNRARRGDPPIARVNGRSKPSRRAGSAIASTNRPTGTICHATIGRRRDGASRRRLRRRHGASCRRVRRQKQSSNY